MHTKFTYIYVYTKPNLFTIKKLLKFHRDDNVTVNSKLPQSCTITMQLIQHVIATNDYWWTDTKPNYICTSSTLHWGNNAPLVAYLIIRLAQIYLSRFEVDFFT